MLKDSEKINYPIEIYRNKKILFYDTMVVLLMIIISLFVAFNKFQPSDIFIVNLLIGVNVGGFCILRIIELIFQLRNISTPYLIISDKGIQYMQYINNLKENTYQDIDWEDVNKIWLFVKQNEGIDVGYSLKIAKHTKNLTKFNYTAEYPVILADSKYKNHGLNGKEIYHLIEQSFNGEPFVVYRRINKKTFTYSVITQFFLVIFLGLIIFSCGLMIIGF